MRGNPDRKVSGSPSKRSIPAYAGEPDPNIPADACYRVYPRVCGGTDEVDNDAVETLGLSPRMRGNLQPQRHTYDARRSIPAYAGEPCPVSASGIT